MKPKNLCVLLAITSAMIICSGCMRVVHDVAISNYAKTGKLLENTPAVTGGKARIVVYYPRAALAGFSINPGEPLGGFSQTAVIIANSKSETLQLQLSDQTATYCDVPAGIYAVGDSQSKKSVNINAGPSQTYYVKIQAFSKQFNYKPPVVVDAATAKAEMEKGNVRSHSKNIISTMVPQKAYCLRESDSPPNRTGLAKLYIIRCHGFLGGSYPVKIGMDSQAQFPLKNKQYCCIWAYPGKHTVSFEGTMLFLYNKAYEIELKSNTDKYLLIYHEGAESDHPVRELTPEEAKTYMSKSKFCKKGHLCL
jgi:hypothetical protein